MTAPPLRRLDAGDQFWPASDLELLRLLKWPSWIEQRGEDPSRMRVVSTLLHGNEPSGCRAVARWLASGCRPSTNVAFYIASVEAALRPPVFTHRMLRGRPDANRTFLPPFEGEAGELARTVLGLIDEARPEALLDLHNNTGHNPAYGVATSTRPEILNLTTLFAPRLVYSDLRLGTLVEATDPITPSVVIECGRSNDPAADDLAFEGLSRFLLEPHLKLDSPVDASVDILFSPIRVGLKPDLSLAFGEERSAADVTVNVALERFNFESMPSGSVVAWTSEPGVLPIVALGASATDLSSTLFENRRGTLVTQREIVPVMMTLDPVVAKEDCLFYATQRSSEA